MSGDTAFQVPLSIQHLREFKDVIGYFSPSQHFTDVYYAVLTSLEEVHR